VKEAIATIEGRGAYSKLKYESGVHRVQRVPATRGQRSHPHVDGDRRRSARGRRGGRPDQREGPAHRHVLLERPGGQSVNTTYSAVRITHLPSGVVVSQQDEKSQIKNRAKAMKVLRSRLYEMELSKQQDAIAKDRRSQVGTGGRSEKIRTYNFPQNRITDSRAGFTFTTHRLSEVLNGDLIELLDALTTHFQSEKLKDATTVS
jgi:peptide chain release factor 1